MSYTARTLIIDSWYLSGIVSEGFETVEGSEISRGLRLLNGLLSSQNITARHIPYFQNYELTGIIGQESYFIDNLLEVEVISFNVGNVRFSTDFKHRNRYFGGPRANNINSLPVTWHYERAKGGSTVYFYFKPNETYPINIFGKFGLVSVTLETDLETVYDNFYLDYLRYALAKRICESKNYTFAKQDTLNQYLSELRDVSPIDLSIQKVSTLQRDAPFNYAAINIGRGWTP